jgi:hypothetical protein
MLRLRNLTQKVYGTIKVNLRSNTVTSATAKTLSCHGDNDDNDDEIVCFMDHVDRL